MTKTRGYIFMLGLVMIMMMAAGCAAEPGTLVATDAEPAGFLLGVWHGFILLVTFIISLFNDSVAVYQAHNTGGTYDLGFVLGVMMFFGGSSGGACSKKKRD